MARYMVFGSVGWDRPIWLDQPLKSGARLLGLSGSAGGSDLPEGRLGGAASNAAACLRNAGHDVAVWSGVSDDTTGVQIRAALTELGVETSNLSAMETVRGATLLLIEPSGERTILFQHTDKSLDRSDRRLRKHQAARIDLDRVQAFDPDGIILRSLFADYEKLSVLKDVIIVAHWPQSESDLGIPADVLIGSRDDLLERGCLQDAFSRGKKACGSRLKWMIVTDGKSGGEILGENRNIPYSSPVIEQVDATGAGDAFAAGVVEALVSSADIVEAARHGAQWGAMTASLRGCAEIRPGGTYAQWVQT